jgi:hypothetical protein
VARRCDMRTQGAVYKWVVRARFDTLWSSPAELPRHAHALTLPAHQSHGGFNDKFAVGPPALLDAYNAQLDSLYNCSGAAGPLAGHLQAETELRQHLRRRGVRVEEASLPIFILRSDGSLSST